MAENDAIVMMDVDEGQYYGLGRWGWLRTIRVTMTRSSRRSCR